SRAFCAFLGLPALELALGGAPDKIGAILLLFEDALDARECPALIGPWTSSSPLEVRKATLRSMLAKAGLGLRFNEHMEGDGPTICAHAGRMGLEDIVSKGKDSIYRSGRSTDWLKFKNLPAPAVTAWGCRAHPCNISNDPPRLRATTSSPYGADYTMPNLLNHLAAPSCSRLGSHWDYVEPKGGKHPPSPLATNPPQRL